MNTNITGRIPHIYLSPIKFFIKELFSRQIVPYLYFDFKFTKNLDVLGNAEVFDYNLSNKPREFLILIKRKQGFDETLNTLAHELVHCKQFAYKELNPECTVWRKQKYNIFEYNHEDLPWEQEAEELAIKLVEKYYAMGRTK